MPIGVRNFQVLFDGKANNAQPGEQPIVDCQFETCGNLQFLYVSGSGYRNDNSTNGVIGVQVQLSPNGTDWDDVASEKCPQIMANKTENALHRAFVPMWIPLTKPAGEQVHVRLTTMAGTVTGIHDHFCVAVLELEQTETGEAGSR